MRCSTMPLHGAILHPSAFALPNVSVPHHSQSIHCHCNLRLAYHCPCIAMLSPCETEPRRRAALLSHRATLRSRAQPLLATRRNEALASANLRHSLVTDCYARTVLTTPTQSSPSLCVSVSRGATPPQRSALPCHCRASLRVATAHCWLRKALVNHALALPLPAAASPCCRTVPRRCRHWSPCNGRFPTRHCATGRCREAAHSSSTR